MSNGKKSDQRDLEEYLANPRPLSGTAMAINDFAKTNGFQKPLELSGLEPSMTRQEFAEDADINTIMKRYEGYAADPMRSLAAPGARYLDLTEMPDSLLGTMELIQEASEAFYRLPATVRREFDNDPVLFTDFAMDPVNLPKMREWGLAEPEKPLEPVKPAPPPEAAPSGGTPPASERPSTHLPT